MKQKIIKWKYIYAQNNFSPYLTSYSKLTFNTHAHVNVWTQNYQYKTKYKTPTIKPLREDIRRNVCDLVLGQNFLDTTSKAWFVKEKKND